MNRILIGITLALVPLTAGVVAQHQTALEPPVVGGVLPYAIGLREVSLAPAPLPTLHSGVAGQWILLAGRAARLHGLTGFNAFDPQYENREAWVIDPATRQSWHKSLLETSPAAIPNWKDYRARSLAGSLGLATPPLRLLRLDWLKHFS